MKKKILDYLQFHLRESKWDFDETTTVFNVSYLTMVSDIENYFDETAEEIQMLRDEVLNNSGNYTPNEVLDIIDTVVNTIESASIKSEFHRQKKNSWFKDWYQAFAKVDDVWDKFFHQGYHDKHLYFFDDNAEKVLSPEEQQIFDDVPLFLATRIYNDSKEFALKIARYILTMGEQNPPFKGDNHIG